MERGSGQAPSGVRAGGGALLAAALLLAFAAPSAGEDPAEAPSLEALMRGMASSRGVVARFRETKRLGLLAEPLESRGTLSFVPPDRLSRVTEAPLASRLVIDGERFSFQDATGAEAIDLSSNPVARQVVANFIVLFNGDLEELRRRYEPRLSGDLDAWRLELRPRDRRLREVVEHVTLEGSGRTLVRMRLAEKGGDTTTTEFFDVRSDDELEPGELEGAFSADGAR